jgi:rubrerythrin
MSIHFNADEIFEMAEQIERNGAKFYRKVAGKTEEAGVRQMLMDLAAMEDQHEKTFASMRAELSAEDRTPVTFDPEGEAALYLQAMADGYVFDIRADPSETLTGEETTPEVLRIAIGLEKDSIVFYLGIREMVRATLGKDKIDRIIKEEMGHVRDLSHKLASLN